ncbi:DfsB family protein [Oceanobacillus piezotolerans]|uniref:DfsB family protein n=1 Tax=Oceanobacillus piezotolerans TaxID=2448030 RepID=A0A498DBE6_9BACI|nr:ClbS/DfsB family four-helix bundle protein [Oceanobacillus piezotolerans]RLL48331.1 DfsB family protein [Oceanobacillus piezotolerans]
MAEQSEKEILLMNSDQNFKRLLEIIESVPSRKRSISIETPERDKNFRDILMHLYEWHAMLERWYREGMDGDTPSIPAPGYKWRNINLLNMQIWENYQDVTFNQAFKKLKLSHQRVMDLIKLHTDEELMSKKYFKWTKTSNLYSYFAANTSNHYLWAIKKCEVIANSIIEGEEITIKQDSLKYSRQS